MPVSHPDGGPPERLLGVIDMGSNSFRLVVYRHRPGRWFRLVDEIREPVRLSEGVRDGRLRRRALARASRAAHLYAAYCEAAGVETVDAVATSAVRDAVNREETLRAISAEGRIPVRVLTEEQEARYGFLGAVNATTLTDGWFLDIGGGSLQVGRVRGRRLVQSVSRPLGAVRLTEAFLTGDQRARAEMKALRRHVADALGSCGWIGGGGRLVGVGGAIRTLAVMHQRRVRHPLIDPQGYRLSREDMAGLIADVAALPVDARTRLPGLKADRADIILAAALAVDEVMELTGAARLEVCAHGLREGVMYEHHMAGAEEPLLPDVRRTSVMNAAERFGFMRAHSEHVARLALAAFDGTARLGLHDGDAAERELVWAAAILHDVGVLVDYSSHQRHSEYLVLNAGLPGFDHREVAIVSALVRGHRKAPPTLEPFAAISRPGDEGIVTRGGAVLRLAEQLDRSRTGEVRDLECRREDGALEIALVCDGDPSLALWSAEREAPAVERAFGLPLRLTAAARSRV